MNLFDDCRGKSLANGLIWLNEPPEWIFDTHGLTIVPQAKAVEDFRSGD